jgi:hypothetical protein
MDTEKMNSKKKIKEDKNCFDMRDLRDEPLKRSDIKTRKTRKDVWEASCTGFSGWDTVWGCTKDEAIENRMSYDVRYKFYSKREDKFYNTQEGPKEVSRILKKLGYLKERKR